MMAQVPSTNVKVYECVSRGAYALILNVRIKQASFIAKFIAKNEEKFIFRQRHETFVVIGPLAEVLKCARSTVVYFTAI